MNEEGKLTFYMHGAREGHKVDLVKADDRAFVEIDTDEELMYSDIACDNGATFSSVMARGKVCLLEDPEEKIKGLKALMKLQTGKDFEINEKMAKIVSVFKVDVDEYTVKMRTE
jgi:nitroimidazol reductase NimA-like FMN-containing flavoprotein (pyridoxamine 5'-phosphate oxidase superfamily)